MSTEKLDGLGSMVDKERFERLSPSIPRSAQRTRMSSIHVLPHDHELLT